MNFFTDNKDLLFNLEHMDLEPVIAGYEDGFREQGRFDYAPVDSADARDSYRRILELAGDIACRIVSPLWKDLDEEHTEIRDGTTAYGPALSACLKALVQAELMGCCLSRQYGGLNLPTVVFAMLVEIISRADAGLQNIFGLQGCAAIIEAYGDEAMKKEYLPLFAQGTVTGAMALTEDEAGSDLQNVKLQATEQPDGAWLLNGAKRFITNGGADVLLVLARSEAGTTDGLGLSLFLCRRGPGITVRRLEDKLGIHSSPTCELVFRDVPGLLVGERQRGLVTYVLSLLNGARLATAAQAVGIGQAAFGEALAYAQVRRQYGRRIEQLPVIADMLVGMRLELEASRALMLETARVMDLSIITDRRLATADCPPEEKKQLKKDAKRYERQVLLLTSLAKYYCSEMSIRVTGDALQVLGGSGYMRDYPVEKYYRDARITSIYEGTSQLQIMSAFRSMLSGTLEKYCEELAAGPAGKVDPGLAGELRRCRELLANALAGLSASADTRRMDLCGRDAVDAACDIVMGYLLLGQARHASRKLELARLFVSRRTLDIQLRCRRMEACDAGYLNGYSDIIDL